MKLAALGDAACRAAGERDEIVGVGDVAVRVGRPLAAGDAYARTLIDAADRVLDVVVVEDQLKRLVTLPEELCPVAAPRERGADRLCDLPRTDRGPARYRGCDGRPSAPMKRIDRTTSIRR
jgi:hypothetical protein